MAFASTTIWEIQSSGNDSANGCGFNPENTSMATTGSASNATTSSFTFGDMFYSFQSRDIGHWLFIKAGTNCKPGWYKISSVFSGFAVCDASAGNWVAYNANGICRPGTTTGMASSSSPSSITWTVDYSQSTGISFTDMVAASTTTCTSSATPINVNFVANIFKGNSGTNWQTSRWEMVSVSGSTGTAGNFSSGTTIATSGATGGNVTCGGPAATPGAVGGLFIGSNSVYQKSGTSTLSSTTANVSGGRVSITANGTSTAPNRWIAYYGVRGDKLKTARALLQVPAAGVTGITVFGVSGSYTIVENLAVDAASKTSIRGFDFASFGGMCVLCKATQCTTGGFYTNSTNVSPKFLLCESSSNSGSFPAFACTGTSGVIYAFCEANNNSVLSMELDAYGSQAIFCSFANNTAGVITLRNIGVGLTNCTIYGGSGYGVYFYAAAVGASCTNCYVEGVSTAFTLEAASTTAFLFNCAAYNFTTAYSSNFAIGNVWDFVTCTATALTNGAAGDLSLNNNSGGGKLLRAKGLSLASPSGAYNSYLDIGVAQHADPGGYTASRTFLGL